MCPGCSALMYLHGIPVAYCIIRRILLSIHPNALGRSISMSWLVVLCFSPFSICDNAPSVGLFGL